MADKGSSLKSPSSVQGSFAWIAGATVWFILAKAVLVYYSPMAVIALAACVLLGLSFPVAAYIQNCVQDQRVYKRGLAKKEPRGLPEVYVVSDTGEELDDSLPPSQARPRWGEVWRDPDETFEEERLRLDREYSSQLERDAREAEEPDETEQQYRSDCEDELLSLLQQELAKGSFSDDEKAWMRQQLREAGVSETDFHQAGL